ncbi:MAG: histidinol-phosphate transaminase [Planctomycetota bacterium]|jgi:histidinol-phosphate aminotransferase|nr:histidinol-phosphate transaminase [Planctomycetota bacterium]
MPEIPKVRACIQALQGYLPGAPARDHNTVKLNQNENRYPPSPAVAEALSRAISDLSLYPDSTSQLLRQVAAGLYHLQPEEVMAANGSDEMLRIFFHAFCDPGDKVAVFYPTYSYYATLAGLQGASLKTLELEADFNLPPSLDLAGVKLVVLPNPNAPTGNLFPLAEIRRLLRSAEGAMLVVDEAYLDFAPAGTSAIPLIGEFPNLAVVRTFSKSYALAGLRLGLGFARAEVLRELEKVRDYYNLDRLAQAAGVAALSDQDWLTDTCRRMAASRERTAEELRNLGFTVHPSQANFLLVDTGSPVRARQLQEGLGKANVLVRHFSARRLDSCLRVSIGTDADMYTFLGVLRKLVSAEEGAATSQERTP